MQGEVSEKQQQIGTFELVVEDLRESHTNIMQEDELTIYWWLDEDWRKKRWHPHS